VSPALVWGLAIVLTWIGGIGARLWKREGRLSLLKVVFYEDNIPKVFVEAFRAEGARALLRLDIALLSCCFLLVALFFVVPAVWMVGTRLVEAIHALQ
jgi:hypothetical protein